MVFRVGSNSMSRSCPCSSLCERDHRLSAPNPSMAQATQNNMYWVCLHEPFHLRRGCRRTSTCGVSMSISTSTGMQGPSQSACQSTLQPRNAAVRDVATRAVGSSAGKADVCIEIGKAYSRLQRPARYNMTYTKALQSFRGWCVLAYECGYREEDLLLKLTEACDIGKSPIPAASVPCCLEAVCLIWETLEQSAKPIKRWAKAPAMTDASKTKWRGFVALICQAYFEQRMAAYPLDRLHLELAATGRLEADGTVNEWSRLVFETLNTVAPQFPKK